MPDRQTEKSRWISMKDACAYLGVSPNTVRKLIRSGVLPAYEIRGVRGFQLKRADVEALLIPVSVKPEKRKRTSPPRQTMRSR